MELTILKETVTLDTAPMHIAPGGSILCHITGNSRRIAKLLIELRSEIAFGMSNVTTIDADSQTITTDNVVKGRIGGRVPLDERERRG